MAEFSEAQTRGAEPPPGEFSESIKKGLRRGAGPLPGEFSEAQMREGGESPGRLLEQAECEVYQAGAAPLSAAGSRQVSAPASGPHARCDAETGARILAVDIGAHGAAALLDEAGELLAVEDLPTLDSGPACRPEISPHLFAAIVRRWAPSRAWVEHVGPRLGDRPAGAFAFGGSRATVETALAVLGVPFRTITPAVWKRVAGIPAGKGMKDLARARAIEKWPAHAGLFARKLDHDRSEAALIGWAGLMRERAGR